LLTFLLSDSGGPAAVDIHDVPIVPAATVISDVNCAPAVACNAAVLGSQTIAVILSVACCWRHCCIPAVAVIPAVAGVPLVPDVLTVAAWPFCYCGVPVQPLLVAVLFLQLTALPNLSCSLSILISVLYSVQPLLVAVPALQLTTQPLLLSIHPHLCAVQCTASPSRCPCSPAHCPTSPTIYLSSSLRCTVYSLS
jgi:hypothetical protein